MAFNKFVGGIVAGSTSVSVPVTLVDSSFAAVTGKAYTDVTASYHRQGAAAVAITPATLAAVTSAYSSGGFKEVSSSLSPGEYRLDVPDAAFAVGADTVTLCVQVTGALVWRQAFALSDPEPTVLYVGTAATGTSFTNVYLGPDAAATDNFYDGCQIRILSGSGAGGWARIIVYDGATKLAQCQSFNGLNSSNEWFRPQPGSRLAILNVPSKVYLEDYGFRGLDDAVKLAALGFWLTDWGQFLPFQGDGNPMGEKILAEITDRTGHKLAADGLDAVATTEPATGNASAWNFREKLVRLAHYFQAKRTLDGSLLKSYDLAGSAKSQQAVSDDGMTQTINVSTSP